MSSDGTRWGIYDDYLNKSHLVFRQRGIEIAKRSFRRLCSASPGFYSDAKRNGITQPILTRRISGKVANCIIDPSDEIYIGDEVSILGENWLVMDSYMDEYGLTVSTLWLCNHILKFQDCNGLVYEYNCVIDDGSYNKQNEKSITTAEAQYSIYLPLDVITNKIHIDKRLSMGYTYNKLGNKELQVAKVTWVDRIINNNGEGSHLLQLKIGNDVFSKENDNIDLGICDYIKPSEDIDALNNDSHNYQISGKDTIKIGTNRSYIIQDGGVNVVEPVEWIIECSSTIPYRIDNHICSLHMPLNDNLIGETITLITKGINNKILCSKQIKVVTIG